MCPVAPPLPKRSPGSVFLPPRGCSRAACLPSCHRSGELTLASGSGRLVKRQLWYSKPFSQGRLWSKKDMKNVQTLAELDALSKCRTFFFTTIPGKFEHSATGCRFLLKCALFLHSFYQLYFIFLVVIAIRSWPNSIVRVVASDLL